MVPLYAPRIVNKEKRSAIVGSPYMLSGRVDGMRLDQTARFQSSLSLDGPWEDLTPSGPIDGTGLMGQPVFGVFENYLLDTCYYLRLTVQELGFVASVSDVEMISTPSATSTPTGAGPYLDWSACAPFITAGDLLNCCDNANGLTPDSWQVQDAIYDASMFMYYATGRQFGINCTTLRPCIPCACECFDCMCDVPNIDLGLWPITKIRSVHENGVTTVSMDGQHAAGWHIREFHMLARDSGERLPIGNHLHAVTDGYADARDNDCTAQRGYVFEICVEYGIPVPHLVKRATRILACEFLNDCMGKECKLPERVTSVTRRGLSMSMPDPQQLLAEGRTGIMAVDFAIETFNPSRLQSPSFAWNPDLRRNRMHREFT